jgi:phage tail-like protein
MAELNFAESYRTNGFVVEIEGTQCPVTKVTGLTEGASGTIDQPDAGSGVVHKISDGKFTFEEVSIERNVDGTRFDAYFRDWFSEMFQLHGPSLGSSVRRNGAISLYNNGDEVTRFVFYGGWLKSSKFSDLEAGSTNLFKQTVVMEHDGMERVI